MKQTVDVIIPTYNGLPYLKETVESVLGQTYKDLAIHVIDDGSTDNKATEKYVKSIKDPRVKYFRKENGGQATARNYGIKVSNSPYVTFVDSDDVWFPTKIERQLALLNEKKAVGMVYGFHHFIDDNGEVTGSLVIRNRGKLTDILVDGNSIAGSGSMVMIRRSVLDKVGLFREDFLIGEDWEMWLRIAQDYEIDYVPDFLAALRVHSGSMQQNFKKMANGMMYMFPIMQNELKLTRLQQRRLADVCFGESIRWYHAAKDRKNARRTLLKYFLMYPRAVINPRNWIGFSIGLYTRVVFGNRLYITVRDAIKPPKGK